MTRSMPHLAISAAFIVTLSACGAYPGDLGGFIEPGDTTDLSESEEAAVRASGEAWKATLDTQDAEAALTRGIADGDLEAVREAASFRPEDPRYPIYEQILTTQQTLDDTCKRTVDGCEDVGSAGDHRKKLTATALELLSAQHPGWSDNHKRRTFTEMQLDALRVVIESTPGSTARDKSLQEYCQAVQGGYSLKYASEFPLETTEYIFEKVGASGLALCG